MPDSSTRATRARLSATSTPAAVMAEETEPDLDGEAEPGPRVRRLVRGADRAAPAELVRPSEHARAAIPENPP